jgi:hypothetical protein
MKARRRIFDLRAGSGNPIAIMDAREGGQAQVYCTALGRNWPESAAATFGSDVRKLG